MGKPRASRTTLFCTYPPCGQAFDVIPSKVGRAKYCSRQCQTLAHAAIWAQKAAAMRIPRVCAGPGCHNVFTVKPSDTMRKNGGIYCSRACQGLGTGPSKRQPLAERFWKKVARAGLDQCWLWQGGIFGQGYGKIWVYERRMHVGAHVVSWFLTYAQWPEVQINVCHSCDTPLCVNPKHLWLGTQQANIADASAKGRMKRKRHPA